MLENIKDNVSEFVCGHPVVSIALAVSIVGVPLLIWGIVRHFKNR